MYRVIIDRALEGIQGEIFDKYIQRIVGKTDERKTYMYAGDSAGDKNIKH